MKQSKCYGTEMLKWETCISDKKRSRILGELACDNCIGNQVIELTGLVYKDQLTQIPNRRYIYEKFNDLKSNKASFGALFIDIANFRYVNQNFGHEMGDSFLINTANFIEKNTKSIDSSVARFGGDEFAILMEVENIENLNIASERLQAQYLKTPFIKAYNKICIDEHALGLKINSALYEDGMTRNELFSSADPKGRCEVIDISNKSKLTYVLD